MTYGFFRPTIFLPSDARDWSAERRRLVLLHELAHVRRGDVATHLLARIVLSFHCWNPLAWSAWREFLQEREKAADDLVLSVGAEGPEYAGHLLEIARSMQLPSAAACPVVAMASSSQLESRLRALLDSSRDRKAPRRVFAMTAFLAVFAIVAPLAALQASADSVRADAPQTSAATAVTSLLQLGDDAREQRHYDQAKAIYTRLLNTSTSGPAAAMAFLHRGTVELAMNDFSAAAADFEQAQIADPRKASEGAMWSAIAQQRQNNVGAAAAMYQSALAAADPYSAEAITVMDLYSQLLDQQGQHDQAAVMRQEAAASRTVQSARAATGSQSGGADVYHAGKGVNSPVLTSKVEPLYTEEGRLAKYEGTAVLAVEIGEDGLPHHIRVVRTLGFGLDQKALEAVSQWKFKPGTKDGSPVKVAAAIEVRFRLL